MPPPDGQIEGVTEAAPASPAPDWDLVPFDVSCARCGQDLRGLTEPVCPRCQLAFDWAEAVPLEELTCLKCGYHLYGLDKPRCPECGEWFDWHAVLAACRARRMSLFEYSLWQQPIRSLVRSWLLLWRPARFWRRLNIHDPPRVGPLLAMVAAFVLVLFVITPLLGGFSFWALREILALKHGYSPGVFLRDPLHFFYNPLCEVMIEILPAAVIFSAFVFTTLLLFRQSMRRYKVKTVHVLRCWAYAVHPSLIIIPALFSLAYLASGYWEIDLFFAPIFITAVGPVLLHIVWSLRCAYRHYLKMDHSWGVALASLAVALLAVLCVGNPLGSNLALRILVDALLWLWL